jgi:gluconolactonase
MGSGKKRRPVNISRRKFFMSTGLGTASILSGMPVRKAAALSRSPGLEEELYNSKVFTEPGLFNRGIEGPCCAPDGNLYCVKLKSDHDIAKVTPEGYTSVFVEMPDGGMPNGIRFNKDGDMFVAEYINHKVFRVDMKTRSINEFCHEPRMKQPNDLAIRSDGVLFATGIGKPGGDIWRIETDGTSVLLEDDLAPTNGIDLSPDEKILYINQHHTGEVSAYDLSPEGNISNRRVLITFPEKTMDGMRCDIKGNLYITRHREDMVTKLSPEGKVILDVIMTGSMSSNVAFGGPDGCTCHVTVREPGHIETFRTEYPGRNWMLYKKWGLV